MRRRGVFEISSSWESCARGDELILNNIRDTTTTSFSRNSLRLDLYYCASSARGVSERGSIYSREHLSDASLLNKSCSASTKSDDLLLWGREWACKGKKVVSVFIQAPITSQLGEVFVAWFRNFHSKSKCYAHATKNGLKTHSFSTEHYLVEIILQKFLKIKIYS